MIKQNVIDIFHKENYAIPAKKNYDTNKTGVKQIDNIWSLNLPGMTDYGKKSNRGYSYVLAMTDKFSKYGWCIALKRITAQTISNDFSNNIQKSNRNPSLIKTDGGKNL